MTERTIQDNALHRATVLIEERLKHWQGQNQNLKEREDLLANPPDENATEAERVDYEMYLNHVDKAFVDWDDVRRLATVAAELKKADAANRLASAVEKIQIPKYLTIDVGNTIKTIVNKITSNIPSTS